MIDYSKLQELDYVLTTSRMPIACIIRCNSSGYLFNQNIATHCGILISIKNKFFIAEMLPEGLRINSLKKYMNKGFFSPKIVNMKRNPAYNNYMLRATHSEQIVSDYFETIKYDFKGVLSYVWEDIKERPNKFYCSEYLNYYAGLAGFPIKAGKCSPFDIQIESTLLNVDYINKEII